MIPRRNRLTRRLATWSFALLVIGGAALDATVLSKQPAETRANVEVAPTPVERVPEVVRLPRLLAADEPRPMNRLDVDGMTYQVHHTGPEAMSIELRAAAGCTIHVDGLEAPAPLRAEFPDGTYQVWSSCDPAGTPITRLVVRSR